MKLKWRKGKKALCAMVRGPDAVVQGSVVYLRNGTQQVHGYDSTTGDWFQLPHCPHGYFSLAVVDNLLTAIGGMQADYTSTSLSLEVEGSNEKWVEKLPQQNEAILVS